MSQTEKKKKNEMPCLHNVLTGLAADMEQGMRDLAQAMGAASDEETERLQQILGRPEAELSRIAEYAEELQNPETPINSLTALMELYQLAVNTMNRMCEEAGVEERNLGLNNNTPLPRNRASPEAKKSPHKDG